jgi:hypothetical protein
MTTNNGQYFLVQEAIHSNVKAKGKGMVIKLDMANAFDRVRHGFFFRFRVIWVQHQFHKVGGNLYQQSLDCSFGEWRPT